jgi:hypothetical protein
MVAFFDVAGGQGDAFSVLKAAMIVQNSLTLNNII